jgi:hypothetical protein
MKRDGWERFSIRANTRPDRLPARTTPDDFLLPSGHATVGMFIQCGVAAFGIALLLVLAPIALFVAYTPIESLGGWPYLVAVLAWAAIWAGLFVGAVRESRGIEEWLADQ